MKTSKTYIILCVLLLLTFMSCNEHKPQSIDFKVLTDKTSQYLNDEVELVKLKNEAMAITSTTPEPMPKTFDEKTYNEYLKRVNDDKNKRWLVVIRKERTLEDYMAQIEKELFELLPMDEIWFKTNSIKIGSGETDQSYAVGKYTYYPVPIGIGLLASKDVVVIRPWQEGLEKPSVVNKPFEH